MKSLIALLTVFTILLIPNLGYANHPQHMSLAEVQWNPETGNFEVSLSVWPADLEKALSLMLDRPTNLDTAKNLDQILEDYIEQHFGVSSTDIQRHKFCWVGSEITPKRAWLYFEIEGQSLIKTDRVTIENDLFFELNENQTNLIQFKSGKRREYGISIFENRRIALEIN